MPYIECINSGRTSNDAKEKLISSIVQAVKNRTGKPEDFIMSRVEDGAALRLGRDTTAAAYVTVRLVGSLHAGTKESLTRDICQVYEQVLGIEPDRVYVVFEEVAGVNWGWNNRTFA